MLGAIGIFGTALFHCIAIQDIEIAVLIGPTMPGVGPGDGSPSASASLSDIDFQSEGVNEPARIGAAPLPLKALAEVLWSRRNLRSR